MERYLKYYLHVLLLSVAPLSTVGDAVKVIVSLLT